MEQMQNLCHGCNKSKLKTTTIIIKTCGCALLLQDSRTCNSLWHTQTHCFWGPGGHTYPYRTKAYQTLRRKQTHIIDHPGHHSLAGLCPLVSQWILLQPSLRMIAHEPCNKRRWLDQVKKRVHSTTSPDLWPFIRSNSPQVLIGSCYNEH